MAGKLFLVFCAGCSGGSWLEKVCNTHPQVRAWEEVVRQLGFIGRGLDGRKDANNLSPAATQEMYKTIIWFLENQSRRHGAVGLIKSFNYQVLDYCLGHDTKVIQLTRNPLKVVGFKYAKTEWEMMTGDGEYDWLQIFETHVRRYAERYQTYLERAGRFPIIRAEVLSASLMTPEAQYFRQTMESLTRVEWGDDIVAQVKQSAHPRGREDVPAPDCWKSDPFVELRYGLRSRGAHSWDRWNLKQREIFVEYFEPIMAALGYNYGD